MKETEEEMKQRLLSQYTQQAKDITDTLQDFLTDHNRDSLTQVIAIGMVGSHLNGMNEVLEDTLNTLN